MTTIETIDIMNYHSGALRDADCPSWDGKGSREVVNGTLITPGRREVAQGSRHGPSENSPSERDARSRLVLLIVPIRFYFNHWTCVRVRSHVPFH